MGFELVYSDGLITILHGNKIIDRFETGVLSLNGITKITSAVERIVERRYVLGNHSRIKRLEKVRHMPIY